MFHVVWDNRLALLYYRSASCLCRRSMWHRAIASVVVMYYSCTPSTVNWSTIYHVVSGIHNSIRRGGLALLYVRSRAMHVLYCMRLRDFCTVRVAYRALNRSTPQMSPNLGSGRRRVQSKYRKNSRKRQKKTEKGK